MHIFLIGSALLILFGFYIWLLEPSWFRGRRATYSLGGQPACLLLLTDLHFGWGRPWWRYQRLLHQLRRLHHHQPLDAIFLGGDYLDCDQRYLSQLERFLNGLQKLSVPIFAILGDHDHDNGTIITEEYRSLFGRTGITLLEDEMTPWRGYQVYGVRDLMFDANYRHFAEGRSRNMHYKQELRTYLSQKTWITPHLTRQPTLVLSHNPDAVFLPGIPDEALVMAGHTHGGQIWPMRWLGTETWFTIPQGTWGSWVGRKTVGQRNLVISRGIGCSHWPLRFNCRPEYWVIELT